MRGLPFSACVADILAFFEEIPSVDHENILFVYDSSGRPSGEAYVYFTDGEGCKSALKMDKKEMGSRYIELFPTSESDIQRASRLGRLRVGKSEKQNPRRLRASARAQAPGAKQAPPKQPEAGELLHPVVALHWGPGRLLRPCAACSGDIQRTACKSLYRLSEPRFMGKPDCVRRCRAPW